MKSIIDAIRRDVLGIGETKGGIPVAGQSASSNPGRPRSTLYLIDCSGSMADTDIRPNRYEAAGKAIAAAIRARMGLCNADATSVVAFNTSEHVILASTPIEKASANLTPGLRSILPRGGTRIAAGLKAAMSILNASSDNMDRHLVLLSDGHDYGRPHSLAEKMKTSGVLIDCIGVGRNPSDVDEKRLRRIASVVDGVVRYRFITDANDLTEHFESISTGICRT